MKTLSLLLLATSLCWTATAAEKKIIEIGTKPESVCRGFGGKLYVTMLNGSEPGDGEIKVLDGDESKVFAKGLNNPKGMAFVGGFLVVSDETMVRKIDKKGKVSVLAAAKDFPKEVTFLNDVAASRDGKSVYVTDMSHPKWMFEADRKLWPVDSEKAIAPMTGCVYKVTLDGEVSLAVPPGDKKMPGPNGVTVIGKKDQETLLMGDFFTGNIVSYADKKFRVVAKGMRGADAVEVMGSKIYVSSWPLGKVWSYDRKTKKTTVLADDLTTAADFYLDRKGKQLVIPDMLAGKIVFLPIE
jgi:DNA-binding beta-propeller fold protein YncE